MADERPDVRVIFCEALDREAEEDRLKFLDEACQSDSEVRARVDALLRAHSDARKFLDGDAPGAAPTSDQPITEQPGTQIGPYKLLQQLGEGGMGVVYMAEQKEPVKRRVALKIIKPGMDTRQVIARFEAERQALAMMDHPNIAKVLDAGSTDSGRPYFAMELVNGVRITDYCDEQHLTPKERLDLFLPVCQAVQHAHQKGIIHRDLKPSNILIALYDGQPVPKVIDFGVAKATSQALTDKTLFTELGQVVGTLEYMSPEQAQRNQLDIDTRTDIYSLGVVLYELLTGTTPFERKRFREAAIDEVLRIIREEEPERPSMRLSSIQTLPSVAASRRTEPQKLRTVVRGELDWIVMKSLEKDRARRYETANGFAEDIQHYLNDEAVVACPPSRAYRFRKFARRNKATLGTAALIFLALLSGVAVATWQAVLARRAAQLARTEAAISKAVNDFVNNDLLEFADPEQEPDRNIPLRTVLDRASEGIQRFEGAPLVEASIRHTLGKTYLSLGEYKTAEPHLKRAVGVRQDLLGKEHRDTLRSMHLLTQVYHKQALFKKADRLNQETYTLSLKHLGEEDVDTLDSMSSTVAIHISLGRYFEAEELCQRTLELQRRILGKKSQATLASMGQLAQVAFLFGRYRDAEQFCLETLAEMDGTLRSEHPKTLAIKSLLATVYRRVGRLKDSERLTNQVLDTKQRVLGEEHPDTLKSMQDIGWLHAAHHRYRESYDWFERLLKMRQRVLGEEHRDTLYTQFAVAWMNSAVGADDDVDRLEEVYNDCKRVLGPEHPDTLDALALFAIITGNIGNYDTGVRLQKKALELRRRALGRDHPSTFLSMQLIARVCKLWGRLDESEEMYTQALAGQRRVFGKESVVVCETMQHFASLLQKGGRSADAERVTKQVVTIYSQTYGEDHINTLNQMQQLALTQGRWKERLEILDRMLEHYVRDAGEDSFFARNTTTKILHTHVEMGDFQTAERHWKEGLKDRKNIGGRPWIMTELGNLYTRWHRYDDALSQHTQAFEIWLSLKGPNHPKTILSLESISGLAALWFEEERYDKAEAVCRQVLEIKADHADAALNLCASLLAANDIEGYQRQCREFLIHCKDAPDPVWAQCVASCFSLHPWPSSDIERPLELARLAVGAKPNARQPNTLGALLFRTDRLEESLEELTNAANERDDNEHASDWFWLSMTHHALGNSEEAQSYYDRGVAWLEQNATTPTLIVLQVESSRHLDMPGQSP